MVGWRRQVAQGRDGVGKGVHDGYGQEREKNLSAQELWEHVGGAEFSV